VLQQTLGLLEKGEIDLSERERAKRIEVIREVVQGQKLKRYRTLLDRLLKEREERLRAWEKLPHLRRSELEQSVERRRSELRGVQAAIEDLKRKIRLAEEETKRKLVEIERLASELLGTEVELIS
jgi:chromosome segregation ATPase